MSQPPLPTTAPRLHSTRLDLIRAAAAHLETLIAGPSTYQARFGLRVEEGYLEFPEALAFSLRQAESSPLPEWWLPYLIIHRADQALIGLGGFKGPPDPENVVEIGYGIAPAYRGQGFATEFTTTLAAQTLTDPRIALIRAHTLPETNASARVLEKCGFQNRGSMEDPTDGPVWRWELSRRTTSTSDAIDQPR